jgi:hypothetical protein
MFLHRGVGAFQLECFGPGRGMVLPGAASVGGGAMQLPNVDWTRERPNDPAFLARTTSPGGRISRRGVLDDFQNPPLWAPHGRSPSLLDTITKGSDISTDRVDILSYRQVVTWRIENLAAPFAPLLPKQLQKASSAAKVKILRINATWPPLFDRNGVVIDTVWADFTITGTWKKGEPGPWVDMSGAPCSTGATCLAAPGCATMLSSNCAQQCDPNTVYMSVGAPNASRSDAACDRRPYGTMNLMESYRPGTGDSQDAADDRPSFLKLFLTGSSEYNGIATGGGCVSASACLSQLVSPLPLHQTTKSFTGEPDIRTYIEYTVDNRQDCNGQVAATSAFDGADLDNNNKLSVAEVSNLMFQMGIKVPGACLDPSGENEIVAGTRTSCVRASTGLTFQFASVQKCIAPNGDQLWVADAFGTNWSCAYGSTCPSTITERCCDVSESPDDPNTGSHQQMSELRCEKQSTGNRWTIGTSDSCVSAAGTPHPLAPQLTQKSACEEERSNYTFTNAVAATCLHRISGQPLLQMAGGTLVAVTQATACAQNASYIFSASTPATCLDALNVARPGWQMRSGSAQYASVVHECNYQASAYSWRPCVSSAGTVVVAATQDECIYSLTGNTWVPEMSQRCMDLSGADRGSSVSKLECESTPNGNVWFADRWATANGVRTGDPELTWKDLLVTVPDFVPSDAQCAQQSYLENGNLVREYKCIPQPACHKRCKDSTISSSTCAADQVITNACDYGQCVPQRLKYGNLSEIPPPFDWRCWDSCKPIQNVSSCPHLLAKNFLVDELVQSAYMVSNYLQSFAATCDDEFGHIGYESECQAMRCHHMATVFQTVCDNRAVLPPCRSTCQAFISHATDMGLSHMDACADLQIKINVSDPPNSWAQAHCRAIQNKDCLDFPADDSGQCDLPVRYPAGARCVIHSQCASGGCPLSAAGVTGPNEEGLGGYCCAEGLGDCAGNGLCGMSGACVCDFWYRGDDCAQLGPPAWLVLGLIAICVAVCCGVLLNSFGSDVRWHYHEWKLRREALRKVSPMGAEDEWETDSSWEDSDGGADNDDKQKRKRDFISSEVFTGSRSDYEFKMGPQGVGFYRKGTDGKPKVLEKKRTKAGDKPSQAKPKQAPGISMRCAQVVQ